MVKCKDYNYFELLHTGLITIRVGYMLNVHFIECHKCALHVVQFIVQDCTITHWLVRIKNVHLLHPSTTSLSFAQLVKVLVFIL